MEILVHGLPAIPTEQVRNHAARFMAIIAKEFHADPHRIRAVLNFGLHDKPERAEHRESSGNQPSSETDRLTPLLRSPRENARALRLSGVAMEAINLAVHRISVRNKVYVEWGLREVDPVPRLSLNFSGPPGTGKTLAAHYVAKELGKPIVEVSYSDVVSKYFGQAAKNLSGLYSFCAEREALLFIDEAETLLSKRSTSAGDGADHAVNSMRSQLLILMERTPVISIFSTNLIDSYDNAFMSRLVTVQFDFPDCRTRELIWESHIPHRLPVDPSITCGDLAMRYDGLNGREIARIVVEASHKVAIEDRSALTMNDFDWAVKFVKGSFLQTDAGAHD